MRARQRYFTARDELVTLYDNTISHRDPHRTLVVASTILNPNGTTLIVGRAISVAWLGAFAALCLAIALHVP